MIPWSVSHLDDFGHHSHGLEFPVAEAHVHSWLLEASSRRVKNGLADCMGVSALTLASLLRFFGCFSFCPYLCSSGNMLGRAFAQIMFGSSVDFASRLYWCHRSWFTYRLWAYSRYTSSYPTVLSPRHFRYAKLKVVSGASTIFLSQDSCVLFLDPRVSQQFFHHKLWQRSEPLVDS